MDNKEELDKLREASNINAQGLNNVPIRGLGSTSPPRGLGSLSQRHSAGSIPRGLSPSGDLPRGLSTGLESSRGINSNNSGLYSSFADDEDGSEEGLIRRDSSTDSHSLGRDSSKDTLDGITSSVSTTLDTSSLIRKSLSHVDNDDIKPKSDNDMEDFIDEEEFFSDRGKLETQLNQSNNIEDNTVIDEQPPSQEDIDKYNEQLKDNQDDVQNMTVLGWDKKLPIIGMCVILFIGGLYTWKHLKNEVKTSAVHKEGVDNALQVIRGGEKDGEANVFGVSDYSEFLNNPSDYELSTEDSLTQGVTNIVDNVKEILTPEEESSDDLTVNNIEDTVVEESYVQDDIKEKYSGKITTPDATEFSTIYYNDMFLESISSISAVMSYTVLDSDEGYILVNCTEYVDDTSQKEAECEFVYRLSKKLRGNINNNGGLIAGDIYISTQTNSVVYFVPSVIK